MVKLDKLEGAIASEAMVKLDKLEVKVWEGGRNVAIFCNDPKHTQVSVYIDRKARVVVEVHRDDTKTGRSMRRLESNP